jgi:plastocyanin domain-containing protein
MRSISLLALLAFAACSSPSVAQNGAVQMSVTSAGFEPQNIKVKKGVKTVLVITRKTDETCAKEIVIDEYKINTKLPLNKPVTVSFTPTKSGELHYGCAMDKMVGGVVTVE